MVLAAGNHFYWLRFSWYKRRWYLFRDSHIGACPVRFFIVEVSGKDSSLSSLSVRFLCFESPPILLRNTDLSSSTKIRVLIRQCSGGDAGQASSSSINSELHQQFKRVSISCAKIITCFAQQCIACKVIYVFPLGLEQQISFTQLLTIYKAFANVVV